MKSTLKLIQINLNSLVRDPGALFWSFGFPALLLIALGLIWGHTGTPELKVGLVGRADSPAAARLRSKMEQVGVLKVSTGTEAREMAALQAGERHLVLVCPPADPARATTTVVRAYYDGRQEASAQLVLATVRQVVTQIEREMIPRPVGLKMDEVPLQRGSAPAPRPVENFIPAIIAMMIIQTGLASAVALTADRTAGKADVFRIPPVWVGQMVAGNVAARMLIGGVQAMAVCITGLLVFEVAIRGSAWVLALMVALGTITFITIGAALGMLARTVEAVNGIVALVSLPMIFLSGLFFPIDVMPGYARTLALALPASYLGDGLRWAVGGVSSVASLSTSVAVLAAWTIGCFLFSVRFYRWE